MKKKGDKSGEIALKIMDVFEKYNPYENDVIAILEKMKFEVMMKKMAWSMKERMKEEIE